MPKYATHCQIAGCGKEIEVTKEEFESHRGFLGDCPQWPVNDGFTGNDRESVLEFASGHDFDGNPIDATPR
ncbi:MAG: hypothetical protein HZA94_02285 [Candidatus Vogelbacteria bacterium]|nr:hypothetical protein [Candidatus Vogelbacteria bacterium]